jgi:hypothetical protein
MNTTQTQKQQETHPTQQESTEKAEVIADIINALLHLQSMETLEALKQELAVPSEFPGEEKIITGWLKESDTMDAPNKICPVIVFLLLKHPSEKIRMMTQTHLRKWVTDVTSKEGIQSIVGCGLEDDLSAMLHMVMQKWGFLECVGNESLRTF